MLKARLVCVLEVAENEPGQETAMALMLNKWAYSEMYREPQRMDRWAGGWIGGWMEE